MSKIIMTKQPIDPETLKIPAFLRNKAIVSQSKQQLILTALDRKQAGLPPNSKQALGKIKRPNTLLETIAKIRSDKKSVRSSQKAESHTQSSFLERSAEVPLSTGSARAGGRLRRGQAIAQMPKVFPLVGTVSDYWEKIGVAGIKLNCPLNKNNFVLIEGEDGLFKQAALEMQIDRQTVLSAPAGSHIGLKVENRASVNGKVYKIS